METALGYYCTALFIFVASCEMKQEAKLKHTKFVHPMAFLKPVIIGVVVIPVSLFLWMFGVLRSNYLISTHDSLDDASPLRWFAATFIPAVIAHRGLKKKSLSLSGALLGYVVGFILTITNYAFMISLMVFFFSSSRATKFRSSAKEKLEEDFKKDGERNWIQVLCNSGVAAYLGVIYFIESGSGEFPIDFHFRYRQSWLSIAILSTISFANGDTWASELGTVLTDASPRLITSWKRVPRGTNGGVTLVGILMSALGGMAVGLSYYLVILVRLDDDTLERSPSQWPIVFTGLFCGLFGSLIDSFLGATCQFSGIDEDRGVIVENPRPGVKWISGSPWLDNHSVNIVSSFITAILGTYLSISFWPSSSS